MQRAIMGVRMLPVSEAFDRFPRLVRDISRKLGKKIQLSVEGEETAADKTIIDALGDPLLHIIRNAIDHGVEEPEERLRVGKPAEASLTLRAYQEADGIVIEVADDGRGIDPARIRNAAVARGLIGADRAERLSDAEALDLIFLPGFSTAREISDLSGRGVGMDVVRSAAESLGGKVCINSCLGRGTTARLALPLTMAVTRVIVVKVGEMLFGVPMDLVVETVRVSADQIAVIQTTETFVLRDRIIPLVRAGRLLGGLNVASRDEEAVLVCRVNGVTSGLVIDDFCGSMDIILKPLDGVLAGMSAYSGTAMLGDGGILLVLNLKELI
jgi:two-component system chemotaxis sensor kinase CheA